MSAEYYKHVALDEWYMLETKRSGKGFRFQMEGEQKRNMYFTFEERTAEFLDAAVKEKIVVKISRTEYLAGLLEYLRWVEQALKGVEHYLEKFAA